MIEHRRVRRLSWCGAAGRLHEFVLGRCTRCGADGQLHRNGTPDEIRQALERLEAEEEERRKSEDLETPEPDLCLECGGEGEFDAEQVDPLTGEVWTTRSPCLICWGTGAARR